jgi:2-amino-4-hydroxy-6-hydroxymethyldihydropteridine diphosphokinase
MKHRVYLGLGTNLGDRTNQLREALNHIRKYGGIHKISPCYETKPVGYADQPDFLNLACLMETELSPQELLKRLKDIEEQMGRQPSFRNAPRPIDIDILLFDDLILDSPDLTIPHLRMSERAFVLAPLADIAAEIVHPVLHLSVAELLARADRNGVQFFSPGLSDEVVESFYLETKDHLFFAVKGLEHPPDRWIAVLRYAPDPMHGNRAKDGQSYRRFYDFAGQEDFLRSAHPEYLVFDPCFQTTLQSVPRIEVRHIYDPCQRLQQLAEQSAASDLQKDAVSFARLLQEKSGAPLSCFGISGSLLIGLQNEFSDLDISIFGEQNCYRVYQALGELLDDASREELSRLDNQGMTDLFKERSAEAGMNFPDFLELESRKVNQGRFRDRIYFVRFIRSLQESGECYGEVRYTQAGRVEIAATIANDQNAIFTPCKYSLSDVRALEGRPIDDLTEIVSFRGRFCEQARAGETILASGAMEMVQAKDGRAWRRLLLGNFPEDKMILRRE